MQSKTQTAIEVTVSTAVAFAISVALQQWLVAPLSLRWHLLDTFNGNLGITVFYTLISLARSYGFRRFFNWLHHRSN
jgi:hypothetical protein